MGWIDSIWGKRSDDPLGTLDPKLQEFLRKESPLKYDKPTSPPKDTTSNSPDAPADTPTSVPSQSLFPDGRYAHLWKSYTPLADVESASKSDSERLTDVVTAFRERKKEIGRAALENCAEWQSAWRTCYSQGSWSEKAALCSQAARKFERCYDTNVRLLKALGYQASYNRALEIEEDIQMQADALYGRILAHDAAVETAKETGAPVPEFDPAAAIRAEQAKIFKRRQENKAAPKDGIGKIKTDPIEPTEKLRAEWDKRIAELPERERVAELEALRADLTTRVQMARAAEAIWEGRKDKDKKEDKKEVDRKEVGKKDGADKMVWEQLWERWKGS